MAGQIRIFLVVFFFSICVQAKPLNPEQVPEPLKPWVDWVLQDQAELGCPFLYNNYDQKRCSWPSGLALNFSANAGKFSMTWSVHRESWISLPGNQGHWPQHVTANGKAVAVIERNGLPAVKLQPGTYAINGEFTWNAIPESLNVPADSALISLQINNSRIATPTIREGQLWLTENDIGHKKAANLQNALDIQVYRLITDDVPMQVTTRLILDVSGEQREVKLARPLLDGFIPLGLTSALPARIEPDGQLLVQVRPGQWQIDISARSQTETNSLSMPTIDKDWPTDEIWAFDARPDLRVVEVEKPAPIDASQTNAPAEWRHLPTYNLNQGESLTLKVIRRGDANPDPNQLTLRRQLWLDFDGGGYTINDVINGKMRRDWRLDAQPEIQLGRVNLNGSDQLITINKGSGRQGVEVRQGTINLVADSRQVGAIGTLGAVGWAQSFNQVSAELNLPPGWRLLAASGVDNVPDSWISRWSLLDLFLVLIAALAVSRLFSRNWGILALFTLMLIWHEVGAPQYIWLNILAATALVRVLPTGRFLLAATWYRNLSWLGLILALVPFMASQIRTGIYPQLENPWADIIPAYRQAAQSQSENGVAEAEMAMTAPAAAPALSPEEKVVDSLAEGNEAVLSRSYGKAKSIAKRAIRQEAGSENYTRYDPDAKVQTGPGLPQWQWHRINMVWNGSVDASQQLRLWLLPPGLVMLLNLIRVALVCVMALVLFGLGDKLKLRPKLLGQMLLWFWLPLSVSLPSQDVKADLPSKEMLEELKSRLLETPDCLPNCAQIPSMRIKIDDKVLTINLEVHAQQVVNIPLPSYYGQWFPDQVEVDGKAVAGLYRDNNLLWLAATPGGHQVSLTGNVPTLPSFTLPLTLKPNRVSLEAKGWQIGGVQDDGQIEAQLQFNRVTLNQETSGEKRLAPGNLPPFALVRRTLELGLDWRVLTSVERLSPPDSAIVLHIPLLKGEKITTQGIQVRDNKVVVNLPAQQSSVAWEANLEKSGMIALSAENKAEWIETWQLDASPIWHVDSQGIAAMRSDNEGQWLPTWHPWPGEKLNLTVTRPVAVAGQILTIDNSTLGIRPGKRTTDASLQFTLRSSQGSQHTLILPEQAVLQSLTINGQAMSPRQEGNRLILPVNPGEQRIALNWQAPTGVSLITTTPTVDLGVASVNSKLSIGLGQDRWTLFVWGPKLGPAVLFWGVIVVILILSAGLGKIPLTPLKPWQWFLLLLGLSQMPIEAAGLVVGWLLLLGWRQLKPIDSRRYFNAVQILLGLLTLTSLAILLLSIEQGLLGGTPSMQISGNQSTAYSLNWYQDRSPAILPTAWVLSVPLLAYRLAMLLWSFWLAASLLDWLKWGWQCFSTKGLWHKKPAFDGRQGTEGN